MNKSQVVNIAFALVLLILMTVHYFYIEISVFIYLGVVAVHSLLVFSGSYFMGFNFYFKSYNIGDKKQKQIAITYDDGPNYDITPLLLNILKEENVKATFFCIGENVEKHPEILKSINNDGHIIGTHTYTHTSGFGFNKSMNLLEEITSSKEIVKKNIGKKPLFFRPPFGVTNPRLRDAVKKSGVYSIGWSLRSYDTVKDENKILRRIFKKLKSGDIILFHDNDLKILNVTKQLIDHANKNGFKIVSLEEMLKIKAYE